MNSRCAQHAEAASPRFTPPARMLQRKCACGTHTPGGGTCARCGEGKEGGLQRKLSIGTSNDPLEHEADRIAEQVLAMPAGAEVAPSPLRIQRFTPARAEQETGDVPASVGRALAGSGRLLDAATRGDMEQRFGHDFSQVRVHQSGGAEQSANDVGALAYTVGSDIVFGAHQFAPDTQAGRRMLAHELTHVIQQSGGQSGPNGSKLLQRTPAAPRNSADDRIVADRAMVDIPPIPDIDASPGAPDKSMRVTVAFHEPAVVHLSWMLYDASDNFADGFSTLPTSKQAKSEPFELLPSVLIQKNLQGRCLLRCIGLNAAHEPVTYADRHFYVWRTTPTGVPPDILALEAQKTTLEGIMKPNSGKGFSEVSKSIAQLKDIEHDLAVLKTGTGTHVGNRCAVQPAGTVATDCTNIVMEVLGAAFTQQGRGKDWASVKKKITANAKLGGRVKMSGVDLQAALQSELGWKGIYWAPDPSYLIPDAELVGAKNDEASYSSTIAKKKKTYLKDSSKGYPGVSVDHMVTDYAPEAPNVGKGTKSNTTKTTTQLDKLKKLPFGVLSAHGGYHMTLITNGKVLEVHWSTEATNLDLIEQTDLEQWAVGPASGFHYYASGVIVAPAADIDTAFK